MPGSYDPPTIQGSIKRQTTNYNFLIPTFDAPGWGASMERNFDVVDSILFTVTSIGNVQGAWENSTTYAVSVRVVDTVSSDLYQCYVAHTSAASGSFADDRAAHPTYWKTVVNGVVPRGAWITATGYNPSEIVTDAGRTGVVQAVFTSSASYNQDVIDGNIVTIVDTSAFSDFNTAIAAAPALTTLDPGDLMGVVDVSASNALKKITYTNYVAQLMANTALTGVPTGPTAVAGTNTTQLATTAFVTAAINVVLGGVSATYDTLAEIATKIGTMDTDIASRVSKAANGSDFASAATTFATLKQDATTTATGVSELATNAEVQALSDTGRTVTPSGLGALTASTTQRGIAELADNTEAAALADTGRVMTPSAMPSAIAAYLVANPQANVQRFTADGTWTKPGNGTMTWVFGWGAGGSGGKGHPTNVRTGGAGGGGAFKQAFFATASLASTVAVSIGAGGLSKSSNDTAGDTGGNTTFGALLTAFGGGPGYGNSSSSTSGGGGGGGAFAVGLVGTAAVGGSGGKGSGGSGGFTSTPPGNSDNWGGGGGAGADNTSGPQDGGYSIWGGGGGGGGSDDNGTGAGGVSAMAGAGGAGAQGNNNAVAGTAPAGGGGGSRGGSSGAGARGELWAITI